jgi:RimJ/RimL family protein N-acetyltransferase
MELGVLAVRRMQESDIPLIINYWLSASDEHLLHMGALRSKMPTREDWEKMFAEQLASDYPEKKAYCIVWLLNGCAVGHSNVNKIIFGEEAYMHLHLWDASLRKTGYGTQLVKMTIPYFFKDLQLKKLYCEPYAHNAAPNKTMAKLGFRFVKTQINTPGNLNFEQKTNLWEMDRPQEP